jgi:hypothetical protein
MSIKVTSSNRRRRLEHATATIIHELNGMSAAALTHRARCIADNEMRLRFELQWQREIAALKEGSHEGHESS